MLESFKLLIQTLVSKARMDQNYFVGGNDEGGSCRATFFALPGRELRFQLFPQNQSLTTFDGEKILDIPEDDQRALVALTWKIPKPISAVDGLVRATNPLHLTIFEETGYPD
jgi:hypothetical protein